MHFLHIIRMNLAEQVVAFCLCEIYIYIFVCVCVCVYDKYICIHTYSLQSFVHVDSYISIYNHKLNHTNI